MINRTKNLQEYCDLNLPKSYDYYWLSAYISLAIVGGFYLFFGYRCWRLTMLLTSFGLGSLLFYTIFSSQPMLNETQLISISCSLGFLFGLISILLQYVGLFITGFCFGLILSIETYLLCDIRDRLLGQTTSFWLLIGLILCFGLLGALLTLRFQKLMLVLTSSCLASICYLLVLDYFLQLSVLLRYVHKRLRFESTSILCIRHWIIIFILPILMLFGIVLQYTCTGRNYNHRESWHRVLNTGKKHYQTANLSKIRRHYQQDTLRQQIIPDQSNRFRQFHHMRRANGDTLSPDFIQNIRQQSSTGVRLTVPTKKDGDSTTTTLTHLIY